MGSGRDAMKFNGRSAAAKLKTAEKAELLARWRATMGTPLPFAPSRELLTMAAGLASAREDQASFGMSLA